VLNIGWQLAFGWKRALRDDNLERLFLFVLVTNHLMMVGLTGGLTGPLIPMLFGVTASIMVGYGRSRESVQALALTALGVVVLALMPASWGAPPLARHFTLGLVCAATASTLISLRANIFMFTDAYRHAGRTLERLREDVLTAATERARSLESVGAKVGHELKNPLAAVKSLVQLLARQADDDRARERFAVVATEIARMEALIAEYLSFSRPLAELSPAPVELGAVADDVLAVLEARALTAGVQLSRAAGEARVVGDARVLKEALLNLVANALDATPSGGAVEITIRGRMEDALVEIRDTGRGLSPDELARVGTPFFTTREGGTGLGVVLARTAIVQHGGELRYASEPGKGTTATVTLPARAPVEETHGQAAAR
jgi:signal transduction histidine kinase